MRHRLLSCLVPAALALLPASAPAEVFFNELHYDDATSSGDTGEAVEIVATAGESLSGYRVYLYNGATPSAATTYDNDPMPAGSAVSCGGTARIATVSYPTNGLQNGASDAIALVDASGALVQFLSYEGTVTASNGPAAGRTSSNLPVSETGSTAAGSSLQLGGTGSRYAQFAWQASASRTYGGCNRNQTFGASNTPPGVVATSPVDGAAGVPAAGDLTVTFSKT